MELLVIWSVVYEAGDAWLDDRAPRIAAALAFFTALSIAPLLVMHAGNRRGGVRCRSGAR